MLHIDTLPRPASLLIASAVLLTAGAAQTILPSAASASFPQCALSCTQLIEAQNNCIPPAAPVTDQYTYNNCFCTSALLTLLRSSPDGTCDSFCTAESDRRLLQSWYTGFCASLTATSSVPSTSSVQSALSTVTSGVSTVIVILPPASSSSTSTSPTVTGSGTTVESTSSSHSSWINTHWRWILMLGLLLVGLGLVAFLAIYLKRRHRRKLEEKRAALSGFPAPPPSGRNRTPTPSLGPELWGPHQHMAHTHGWEYSNEQNSSVAPAGVPGMEKKSKRVRRAPSEKGDSRGASRNRTSVREVDSDVPSVISEMVKVQQRKEREQEKERERNRDQYAEFRTQSMRGAVSAFERDRDREQRSQTMREKDKVAWRDRDSETTDVIGKT